MDEQMGGQRAKQQPQSDTASDTASDAAPAGDSDAQVDAGGDALVRVEQPQVVSQLMAQFVRSEVNLLVFPFFALSPRGRARRMETEFRAIAERDGQQAEIIWNVSANPKYGYPGVFDRQVHRAIEQIISDKLRTEGQVENPIAIGSFYSLCERMGMRRDAERQEYGGREYQAIQRALERIATTAIKSTNSFYHKGKKRWMSEIFHLYDAVICQGQMLRDGTIADSNYLYLSDLYLQSLNAFYVKPLDFRYHRSLRSTIASRLYEILGVKFYGVRSQSQAEICFRYSTLTQLLPVKRNRYLSDAKKQLDPGHQELVDTAFLASFEWRRCRVGNDWLICYRPGQRAYDEIRRAQLEQQLGPSQQHSLPGIDEQLDTEPLQQLTAADLISEDHEVLIGELIRRKVSESTAVALVEHYPHQTIRNWIEAISHVRTKNRAAFLVKAIQGNWQLPDDYLHSRRGPDDGGGGDVVTKQSFREHVQREHEAQERLHQEQSALLDELYERLPARQREEVDRQSHERLSPFVQKQIAARSGDAKLSGVTAAIVAASRHEVLRSWLADGRLKI